MGVVGGWTGGLENGGRMRMQGLRRVWYGCRRLPAVLRSTRLLPPAHLRLAKSGVLGLGLLGSSQRRLEVGHLVSGSGRRRQRRRGGGGAVAGAILLGSGWRLCGRLDLGLLQVVVGIGNGGMLWG